MASDPIPPRADSAGRVSVEGFRSEVGSRARLLGIRLPVEQAAAPGGAFPDSDLTSLYEMTDPARRRRRGQFFTPPGVAEFMVRFGLAGGARTVLDPACGLGIFMKKSLSLGADRVTGIDSDPTMVNACHLDMTAGGAAGRFELRNEDYLSGYDDPEKVDFLVCNPPYLNFHRFDRGLIRRASEEAGVRFSALTNIYALFMVRAGRSVRAGGRIAFITPSEFLYTGYGKALKRFLLGNFTIDSFVTFDFGRPAFGAGVLTTATITLMVNRRPGKGHRVKFVRAADASALGRRAAARGTRQGSMDPDAKWQRYFPGAGIPELADGLVPLREEAGVKRGIATGSNEFFTVSERERAEWGIEDRFLAPVVSRASQARGYAVTRRDMAELGRAGQKVHLFCCAGSPSESAQKYIARGEGMGVHERYLCAHRAPWYSVEKREPAPILATAFSRDYMRFVHNRAKCLNLASYHGIYPKSPDPAAIKALLCYLNSDLSAAVQVYYRREYGNGLHKFEPGDLLDLPVLPVSRLGKGDVSDLASLFDGAAGGGAPRSLGDEANAAVRRIAASLRPRGSRPAPGPRPPNARLRRADPRPS